MKYKLIIKPKAEEDLQSAFDWYEEQQSGLGDSFLHQIDLAFEQVLNNPKVFQERYKEVRINFTDQFPFGVHYKVESEKVIVLAILHSARDPKNWKT